MAHVAVMRAGQRALHANVAQRAIAGCVARKNHAGIDSRLIHILKPYRGIPVHFARNSRLSTESRRRGPLGSKSVVHPEGAPLVRGRDNRVWTHEEHRRSSPLPPSATGDVEASERSQ